MKNQKKRKQWTNKEEKKKKKNARLVSLVECVGLVGCRVTVFCGLGVASYPQPPDRSQHGCPVGIDRDPPVAPALTYVSAGAGVVVHVVLPGRGCFSVWN